MCACGRYLGAEARWLKTACQLLVGYTFEDDYKLIVILGAPRHRRLKATISRS